MRFRKKPVVIRAEQFSVIVDIPGRKALFMEYPIEKDEKGYFLIIPTLEGSMRADYMDWIITGVKGERYPCKPDIFEATYERVGEEN